MPVVDAHVHLAPPEVLSAPGVPELPPAARGTLEAALEAAERRGVNHLLLSPIVRLLGEAFDSEPQALELCRLQNRALAALRGPVTALGTVPLRSPGLAAAELRRVLELGLVGVEITATVDGVLLGDERFEPFWDAAERLRAVVFVHPSSRPVPGASHFIWNTIGNPSETAATAAHMVLAGVLDRHPDLDVLLAHGGGALTQLRGRLDHAWRSVPEGHGRLGEPPSAFLRRFRYDSVVYDPKVLRQLVDVVGADRVLLGTDHPFEMAEADPVALVRAAGLGSADEDAILGGNAAQLLGFAGSSTVLG